MMADSFILDRSQLRLLEGLSEGYCSRYCGSGRQEEVKKGKVDFLFSTAFSIRCQALLLVPPCPIITKVSESVERTGYG